MMNIERILPREYVSLFPNPSHIYNSVSFNELNRHKCDEIHYLVFRDGRGKARFGMTLGQRGGCLRSPFSAPFGGIEQTRPQSVSFFLEAVDALQGYAADISAGVEITLPPWFYDREGNVEKLLCAARTKCGPNCLNLDYNYHYPLSYFGRFSDHLSSSARNKFRNSEKSGFKFEILRSDMSGIARAYEVIRANRESHGYPLKMTLDDVVSTAGVVNAMFMVLTLKGEDVAAVQAYESADGIVQVIYWGDAPGFSEYRPMEQLAYRTFGYLASSHRIVDIGPSSSDGIPSVGLCDFKEGLGCVLAPKPTIIIQ